MDLRRRRQVGVGVWAGGLVLALGWGALDAGGTEGVGYGFAPGVLVSGVETARIHALPVQLHGRVTADDVVVNLDPGPLLEERALADANLMAVQQDQSRLAVTEQRRFAEGADATAIDRARIGASLSEDRAALDGLNERLRVEESLLASGASSSQAVDEWRRQIRVVEARISANRAALALASSAATGARERQQAVPVANEWAVVAATRALEVIEGRIARYDLHAGVDGEVSWVYRSVGDVVRAGEPVLQVRPVETRDVVAFVSASDAAGLAPGGGVTVRRASGQVVRGALRSVGAGPQPLPESLWTLPSWPQYGVPVRVELEGAIGPDEIVTVRL